MKDDLFYVQPIVEYATLSDYNHVSKMDFPKRKQPSSMFPTLPDVSPVVPLDALTHHTDMNYPTVNHAYGPFHRPKYYVGKCPSNQFVRNFDTPPPTTTPPIQENFTCPKCEGYKSMPPPYSNGKQYDGNYWSTCSNCSVNNNVLTCCCQERNKTCRQGDGINLSNPPSNTDIKNCNGKLRWNAWPC